MPEAIFVSGCHGKRLDARELSDALSLSTVVLSI